SRCSPRPSPSFLFLTRRRPPPPPLFPYTTLFRSHLAGLAAPEHGRRVGHSHEPGAGHLEDAELVRRAEAVLDGAEDAVGVVAVRSEEHTSELQSLTNLVCRLLLEKKKRDRSHAVR